MTATGITTTEDMWKMNEYIKLTKSGAKGSVGVETWLIRNYEEFYRLDGDQWVFDYTLVRLDEGESFRVRESVEKITQMLQEAKKDE